MRTLNELYLLLWEQIKDEPYIRSLCGEICDLYFCFQKINVKEYSLLKGHFNSQKPSPSQHPEFLLSSTWSGNHYWWNIKEDRNPVHRKAFIQKMIQIRKP